jgi:2-C-methyl-D-erythritol 4-phosphate cytidylyltransferase/2-C-methyl-D-erythritol 2,4-cyclodiphosphate synthase
MDQAFRTYALLAAAGRGERLAPTPSAPPPSRPKAFLGLQGIPLFLHSLAILQQCPQIAGIWLLVPEGWEAEARQVLERAGKQEKVTIIAGGGRRQDSIYRGLLALPAETDYVLIHDAARPFLTPDLVTRCLAAAQTHGAAICALPSTDTIKSSPGGEWVGDTLDRSQLWLVQTPQAFHYPLLLAAHKQAEARGEGALDDASLVEQMGEKVFLVESTSENIKITRPADLALAEAMAARKHPPASPALRIGLGFDAHRFGEGRKLILAGREFPGPGLLGHSDADLICHAVIDAILGAAGMGDIGIHFPDTDPAYQGVSSLLLLEKTGKMIREKNLSVSWLDIVLAAEQPRISSQARAMCENLAEALKINPTHISLKGKTTEEMGFVGRREGLACWAICLLTSIC